MKSFLLCKIPLITVLSSISGGAIAVYFLHVGPGSALMGIATGCCFSAWIENR